MEKLETSLFADEPRRTDIDCDTVELVFTALHSAGGRTKASVAVPRSIVDARGTVERARREASRFCLQAGAGGEMSVSVSMGW